MSVPIKPSRVRRSPGLALVALGTLFLARNPHAVPAPGAAARPVRV